MPDRREFIIGGMGAAAFASAEYLKPRKTIRLFQGLKLDDAVPRSFGPWREHLGGNVIAPTTPNSLADRLYSATVSRIYYGVEDDRPPVMLLIAYGGEQSDLLQLHRPESCYPAVGFGISERQMGSVPLGKGAKVPSVFLSAKGPERLEDIVYWTRLGEALPRTASEQRSDRLKAAMQGTTGDGILVRASCLRFEDKPAWPYLAFFLADLVSAIPAKALPGFVGTRLASTVRSNGPQPKQVSSVG